MKLDALLSIYIDPHDYIELFLKPSIPLTLTSNLI